MRQRLVILAGVLIVVVVAVALLSSRAPRESDRSPPELPPTSGKPGSTVGKTSIRFVAIPSADSGVDFEYYGSPSDEHYMIEQNGGGVALFDADGDGRLDLFLVNGSHFQKPASSAGASHRLFRQSEDWQFDDVTEACGLQAFGFGQGCAAGDYDNDGFCDLFVAAYGTNRLWHNAGDGTFNEVTQVSGVGDERWSTSAAFADLDGDGNPDLYVVNYVDWSPDRATGKPHIPSPMDFAGLPDCLYRNSGDGTFQEIGEDAGIAIAGDGKGLAVAIGDLDGDHQPDIYVANDTTRNFLFRNLGGLKFDENGVVSGCAVSQDGGIGSSMGVAMCDYNRDGRLDLFVTNFAQELLDVFANLGSAGFIAMNTELGVDQPSKPKLNFGIVTADFDSDGWPDLFFANGHIWDESAAGGEFRMRPNLLRNAGGTRFDDVSHAAGDYFQQHWLGRAVAFGDLDSDGDVDLVVSHLLDRPALLRNESERSGQVLQLKLIGTRASRQALGTRVEAIVGGRSQVAHAPSGESFQASHDDRVLIPVGDVAAVDEVRVFWSAEDVEVWKELPTGKLVRLVQGTSAAMADGVLNDRQP